MVAALPNLKNVSWPLRNFRLDRFARREGGGSGPPDLAFGQGTTTNSQPGRVGGGRDGVFVRTLFAWGGTVSESLVCSALRGKEGGHGSGSHSRGRPDSTENPTV